jgi:hypothetical protein
MIKHIAILVLTVVVTTVVIGLVRQNTDWLEAALYAALACVGVVAGAWFRRRYKDAPPLFGRRPDAH